MWRTLRVPHILTRQTSNNKFNFIKNSDNFFQDETLFRGTVQLH